ncbi:DnaT-like ssDNA-binding domain-containing protein [Marinagarivorans algicola]|uniref:DnaT-like ssDNA-binding domain-containing protein n=1 Tax=Marinagarivorans algicola TaxID=1513270 RepID=UPI0006B642E7|nr:DnaT-like ssDNA-binding domain-containing protein [Marinagarivorans algicola]
MTQDCTKGWLPEAPILFYSSLAIEYGVEEALMVSLLQQLLPFLPGQSQAPQGLEQQGLTWYTLSEAQMLTLAPFWRAHDVQRLCTNLREAGVIFIASAPYTQSHQLKFAFKSPRLTQTITTGEPPTQRAQQYGQPQRHPCPQNTQNSSPYDGLAVHNNTLAPHPTSPNIIAPHWQPARDTLTQLAQHNIPDTFTLNQVGEFITYWRDRKEPARSWEAKFFNHVIHKWRDHQSQKNARPQSTLITKEWRPSEDAIDVLSRHASIPRAFIEDAIPEFVLYWREQNSSCDNWNRRFRDHVNRQWARFSSTMQHDTTPKRIADGWQPSRDVYDVLRLANIDLQFAQNIVPEFVIYWRDSNQTHTSWNTRFLQYVKRCWAQRSANPQVANSSSTRDLSLEALVTDRSWAN